MIKKIIAVCGTCLLILLTSSCSTPYAPNSLFGGYEDTYLGNNLYKVHFSGNGFTSYNTAHDFALRRASELTLHSGKRYFQILTTEDRSENHIYKRPDKYDATTTVHNNLLVTEISHTSGGFENIFKPGVTIFVKVLDAPTPTAYDARAIVANEQFHKANASS